MSSKSTCPKCGASFSGGALEGLCPSCVGRLAFLFGPDADQAAEAAAPLPSGAKLRYFGDYELLEEIARGGMGVVYKARQLSLNRIVAVKMILSGKLASAADVARFRAEAEAAANLRHPNIVAIHEVGEQDGQHYFSMDYVEGKSLAQIGAECGARRAEFPSPGGEGRGLSCHSVLATADEGASDARWFRRVAGWLKTVAEAIHYAHQQGTLHRDLKPSNVLIDDVDQPHITDFGLAKRVKHDSDLTLSGQILGTPNFMSPEQAAGKRGGAGPQSDVYSLGAILYYLLTGKPPHAGETVHETLAKVLSSEPAAPRSSNRDVPRDLETICLKCLEKDPRRRYASAQDLAEDLDRFLSDEPILARPLKQVDRLWRLGKRNRLVTSLILALVFVPVVVALLVGRNMNRPRHFSSASLDSRAMKEMPVLSGDGASGVIDGKIYVTTALDGNAGHRKFLHVYDPRPNSWERLADSALTHGSCAAGVIAGKFYLAGGDGPDHRSHHSLEVYDPRARAWNSKASMPTARANCAGAVLNDRFYVVGGDDGTNSLSTMESYDPATDRWRTEEPMLAARGGLGVAAINGALYAVGGGTRQTNVATIESWKPGGKWTLVSNSIPTPVAHAFVAASGGALYVAGGRANGAVNDLQTFEPDRGNLWLKRQSMPEVRYQGSGAVVLEGELYLLGGWDDLPGSRVPHADVFVYDFFQNSWRRSVP